LRKKRAISGKIKRNSGGGGCGSGAAISNIFMSIERLTFIFFGMA